MNNLDLKQGRTKNGCKTAVIEPQYLHKLVHLKQTLVYVIPLSFAPETEISQFSPKRGWSPSGRVPDSGSRDPVFDAFACRVVSLILRQSLGKPS